MQRIRRLYVYLAAFVALGMVVFGLANLLRLLLDTLTGVGDDGSLFFSGDDSVRRQLALFGAVTAVGLPVWLVHWGMAERAARDNDDGGAERASDERRFFLAVLVGLATLVPATIASWRLAAGLLGRLLGQNDPISLSGPIGTAIVAGGLWAYHWRVGRRDEERDGGEAPAGWRRFVVYAAAVGGLVLLAAGLNGLTELLVALVFDARGAPPLMPAAPWWPAPLAGALASIAVGGGLWLTPWAWATRLVTAAGDTPAGRAERRSFLRRFALFGMLFVAAISTLTQLSIALAAVLARGFGAPEGDLPLAVGDGLAATLADALLNAVVLGAIWAVHARVAEREGVATDQSAEVPGLAEVRRLATHLIASVGLGFLVGGAITLMILLADLLTQRDAALLADAGWWRGPSAVGLATVVAGTAVWARQWARVQRWVTGAAASAERRSAVRRAYLAIAAGAGLLMLLGGLAVALYAVLGALLGADVDAVDRLGDVGGWVVGGGALLLYHGLMLRADLAAGRGEASADGSDAPVMTRLALTLIAPAGADPEEAVARLRRALPRGYRLDAPGFGTSTERPTAGGSATAPGAAPVGI